MNSLAQTPKHEYSLTVLNGSEKGATYKLGHGRVSIGRGSENAIVIDNDPKVSRTHAILTITSRGVRITDISDRNSVTVNGETVSEGQLNPGTTIQLGNTKFLFKTLADSNSLEMIAPKNNQENRMSRRPPENEFVKPNSQRSANKPNVSFYVILGSILILGFYLYTTDTAKKVPAPLTEEIREQMQSENEREAEEKLTEIRTRGSQNPQWVAAQTLYIKGFRDFQKGQFDRALESFQACLSLVPNHELCVTYLEVARRRHGELIQNQMEFGRKYKDQHQWAACSSAFRNVMVMIRDYSNPVYKEAQINRKLCDLNAGEKY